MDVFPPEKVVSFENLNDYKNIKIKNGALSVQQKDGGAYSRNKAEGQR